MSTTHDEEQLREEFLQHPPRGVPGGTSRLPRRILSADGAAGPDDGQQVAFVDGGFVPDGPGCEHQGVDAAAGEGAAPADAGGGGTQHGKERVVPELIHVPATTPWEALELPPGASWEQIRSAHRRLLIQWHPDRHVMETEQEQRYAAMRLAEVNAAYGELRAGHRR